MNRINPAKLHNSKWTAVNPIKREKHFLVSNIEFGEDGSVISCKLEAIISNQKGLIKRVRVNQKGQSQLKINYQ